jgi:hypothetical protein
MLRAGAKLARLYFQWFWRQLPVARVRNWLSNTGVIIRYRIRHDFTIAEGGTNWNIILLSLLVPKFKLCRIRENGLF